MRALEIAPHEPRDRKGFRLTRHAQERTHARGFRLQAVRVALEYGRLIHVRGAEIYVLGRKEVIRMRHRGIDLRSFEGMQVVCKPGSNLIMTAYRNRDFGKLRSRGRRRGEPSFASGGESVPWRRPELPN